MNQTAQKQLSPGVWNILFLGLSTLALALRFATIGKRHLWYDELYTYQFCKNAGSLADVWRAARVDGWEHPPLHYMLSYLAFSMDSSAAIFRSPSAIFGTASVIVIMLLGRRLADDVTALFSGLLLCLSVYHINYSQDARPYAMMLFFVLSSYYFFYLYVDRRSMLTALPFSLCVSAALYTHHLSIPALVALSFPAINILYASAKRAAISSSTPGFRHFLLWLVLSTVLIGTLYAWQFQNLLQFLGSGKLAPEHYLKASTQFFLSVESRWAPGESEFSTIYYLFIILCGISFALIQKSRMRVCIPWLALPFLLFMLLPFNKFYDLRFSMAALPAFYLLTAFGLVETCRYITRFLCRDASQLPFKICLALAVIIVSFSGFRTYLVYRDTDYRCSNFFHMPELVDKNNGFCKKHIILNSLFHENSFLLEKVAHSSQKEP